MWVGESVGGSGIYSFKRKKVISRVLIDNKSMKEADKVVRRIDFDFAKISLLNFLKNQVMFILEIINIKCLIEN